MATAVTLSVHILSRYPVVTWGTDEQRARWLPAMLAGEAPLSLLDLASEVKGSPELYNSALAGESIALLFEKPSLRTRMTFELAIQQLGGFALVHEGRIGEREPLKDMARNLDRWVNAIVARTFLQKTVDGLAHWSKVPVINALSDLYHPCQAFADMQTVSEHFGSTRGLKFAFVGDGNNMAHSLMLNAARLGMDFALATPPKYEASEEVVAQARDTGRCYRFKDCHIH